MGVYKMNNKIWDIFEGTSSYLETDKIVSFYYSFRAPGAKKYVWEFVK
jgi:hypothetical protein